ncbi:MAG TPA: tRNA pseudouridine(38-40) synthase TruA [Chitinophagaceae bacterium]|nr:tRNA pseudouridine(38-40) synthase TruA [Chitinophagaceae bacterium]
MPRYFIEVAYKGTHFKGFQIQDHERTIQGELNRALSILLKTDIQTTTSSRTDAGVHAHQNFLHVDTDSNCLQEKAYNINAILPQDMVVTGIYPVQENAHSRFDATARRYTYYLTRHKNPFLQETAYYFPFTIDIDVMNECCNVILANTDFTSFSKKHTDVSNFNCHIRYAQWEQHSDTVTFEVESNRFLRGMVRALVGTMLQVGRKKINLDQFKEIIFSQNCSRADFSAVAKGLFLQKVYYPETVFLPI